MPVATTLDVVDVCVRWATAKKILKADPVEGSRTVFSKEENKNKFMAGHKEHLGIAGNIFWLNLKQWAVTDQKVTLMEAKDYAKKNFKIQELLMFFSYLDKAPVVAPDSSQTQPRLDFQVPVAVAAVGATEQQAVLGVYGTWRKISADPQTYGFLSALSDLIMATPYKPSTLKVLDLMANLALHCPMDIYAFGLQPELEKKIFLKSFQIMENFRKAEEAQAPSAWKICCLWNQAKRLIDANKDVNDGLVELFGEIEFATSSEYKMENLKKKIAKDCLVFYDRAVASGAEDVMPRVRIDLPPKNVLDWLSKLVKISQATSAK